MKLALISALFPQLRRWLLLAFSNPQGTGNEAGERFYLNGIARDSRARVDLGIGRGS